MMSTSTLQTQSAFRSAKLLLGAYLGISVLAMAAIFLLRNDATMVNDVVWIRGSIVAVSAVLTYLFGANAARGSRNAYKRLRIVSAAMVVAITVIVSLPGFLPMWMRIEQALCGVVLIGVVAVINGRNVRSLFAAR